MSIEIDILTREIPDTCNVWRTFAGTGYKFINDFLEKDAIFLDFPGLELPDGDLNESEDLLARILAAQEVVEVYKFMGPEAEVAVDWKNYINARRTVGRGIIRSSAINIYQHAKRGDLIVLPTTLQTGVIHIGAIMDHPQTRNTSTVDRLYGTSQIPSRSVQWLASTPEHKLSFALSSVLRHQNPFSLIPQNLYIEVMSIAYTNFTYKDRFSSVIYNLLDDYLDTDSALIGMIAQISANIIEAMDEGHKVEFDDIELLKYLIKRPSVEYNCSQSADIHSAGFNRFVSAKITPLVIVSIVGVLTYLGTHSNREALAGDIANISVINSLERQGGSCPPPVSEATSRFLSQTDIDIVWEMCQRAREAKGRAGLQPGVAVQGNGRPEMRLPARR
ncbi:hypothetical protein [Methylobacterium tarhaniae]|uniref:hypothetical protein n=1 Tax=Methylobacterium tarhaniae TaxID=1187852 RepID=UPI003D00F73B